MILLEIEAEYQVKQTVPPSPGACLDAVVVFADVFAAAVAADETDVAVNSVVAADVVVAVVVAAVVVNVVGKTVWTVYCVV